MPSASFSFTSEDLKALLEERRPPCVSIYLPTHRRGTETRPDLILYRNLCREAERVLTRDVPGPGARDIKSRLEAFDNEEFWDEGEGRDGLAVFASHGYSAAYRLPGQFPELNVVGATFHTKPLIRFLQGNSLSYHVLAVTLHRVTLFEGHGDSIHEVPLHDVPQSFEEEDPRDRIDVQRDARHRGTDRQHYGKGSHKEHAKADVEKFFRAVAKELWRQNLRTSTRPLILAALGEHQPVFRRVAQIPVLLEDGIVADPARLSPEDLRMEAQRLLQPEIERRIERVKDEYGLARSRGQGADGLSYIAEAVVTGRVKTLLVESGRRVWGILDGRTGEILPGDASKNAYDVDLLDELAEQAIVRGGEVYVLKKDQMPASSGVAAIFRF